MAISTGNEYVDKIFPRFQQIVQELEGMNWVKTKVNRPEELIAEYYQLDREISQLMEFGGIDEEVKKNIILPVWMAGYRGLYKRFPERR
jgi:hypothetical protein